MRIIHLIDSIHTPPSPLRLAMIAGALRHSAPSFEQAVWAVGDASLMDDLRTAGIVVDKHLAAGRAGAGLRLGRALRREPLDVVHAWSIEGAAAAHAMTLTRRLPMVVSVIDPPRVDWLGTRMLRRARVTLLTARPGDREALLGCGYSSELIESMDVCVDAPSATLAHGDHPRRAAQRLAWGVTDERTTVVLAAVDSPRSLDGMTAMLSVGLAAETGRAVRLLISPSAGGLERAQRMAAASRRSNVLLVDAAADRPWEAIAGIDIALALDDDLGLLWAMRAGLPIVAPAPGPAPGMGPRLVDGESALLGGTPGGSPGELARRICRLHDDPELARRLGDAATVATADATPQRFAARLAAVCQSMQGVASF